MPLLIRLTAKHAIASLIPPPRMAIVFPFIALLFGHFLEPWQARKKPEKGCPSGLRLRCACGSDSDVHLASESRIKRLSAFDLTGVLKNASSGLNSLRQHLEDLRRELLFARLDVEIRADSRKAV